MTLADARFAGIALAVGVAVSTLSDFRVFLTTSAIITAIIARSVGFLYSDTRMVSLCQVSFAGVGGWAVGWIALHSQVPVEAALLLGGVAAVPVGVVVGVPALRLRGVNLAVATLGLAAAIQVALFNRGFPGARENFAVHRPGIAISEVRFLWFTLCVAVLLELGLRLLRRRTIGTTWAMVGQSERATAAAGRSVVVTKLTAFATSAFIAGIAGGLLALQIGRVSARQLEPVDSLVVFALAVMAGAGNVLGAAVAGVLSAWFPELLRLLGWSQDFGPMIFAVGAAQVLSQGGDGLASQWMKLAGRFKRMRRKQVGRLVEAEECPPPNVRRSSLVVRELAVDYGSVRAVDNVSVVVEAGQVAGVIGPNGAGKSTLIDAVTGYVPAAGGTMRLGSDSLDGLAVHRRARVGLSRTFQRERTPANLLVGEYLSTASRDRTSAAQQEWLLALFSVPRPETPVAHLDSAERRRLELVAALSSSPSVALVDEPAAGLTDAESSQLGTALTRVAREWGIAILLVAHDLLLVRQVCEVVTVLDQGKMIFVGPTAQALADPVVIASYLGVEEDLK
ncbi:ABC transporter permease subunit [Candidatus Poriferisocius sp.]|uniref:branched-chain amino acid ABC transporter ATP-binding protein/permease n=1 Tax=Candidatus Poriferisocius sp. TaxID=3101276 RepID=UPI003B02D2A2